MHALENFLKILGEKNNVGRIFIFQINKQAALFLMRSMYLIKPKFDTYFTKNIFDDNSSPHHI